MEKECEKKEGLENDSKCKKFGAGKIILIVILVILLLIVGGVFWAYRTITGYMDSEGFEPIYSVKDYEEFIDNLGIKFDPKKVCLDCDPLDFSEPKDVSVRISDSQASAAFDMANENLSYAGIRNSTINFSDGHGELQTVLTFQDRDYPVYISGNIEKDTDTTIKGEVFDLKVAGLNIPSGVKNMVEEALVDLGNERLGTFGDTLRIDDVKLTDEGLDFDGMIPTKAD